MELQDSSFPDRQLHVALRVRDLDASVHFYTALLGMRILRRLEFPERTTCVVFVGYGDEGVLGAIELMHDWTRKQPYSVGDGFGHVSLAVRNVYQACERLAAVGVRILRPPQPVEYDGKVVLQGLAFIADPDGYTVELIQSPPISPD